VTSSISADLHRLPAQPVSMLSRPTFTSNPTAFPMILYHYYRGVAASLTARLIGRLGQLPPNAAAHLIAGITFALGLLALSVLVFLINPTL
jgi:hypothetical protein